MARTPPCDVIAVAIGHAEAEKPMRIGYFRFLHSDEVREWSPGVGRMHGYRSKGMRPTTDQVISHKYPDDHDKMVAARRLWLAGRALETWRLEANSRRGLKFDVADHS